MGVIKKLPLDEYGESIETLITVNAGGVTGSDTVRREPVLYQQGLQIPLNIRGLLSITPGVIRIRGKIVAGIEIADDVKGSAVLLIAEDLPAVRAGQGMVATLGVAAAVLLDLMTKLGSENSLLRISQGRLIGRGLQIVKKCHS